MRARPRTSRFGLLLVVSPLVIVSSCRRAACAVLFSVFAYLAARLPLPRTSLVVSLMSFVFPSVFSRVSCPARLPPSFLICTVFSVRNVSQRFLVFFLCDLRDGRQAKRLLKRSSSCRGADFRSQATSSPPLFLFDVPVKVSVNPLPRPLLNLPPRSFQLCFLVLAVADVVRPGLRC